MDEILRCAPFLYRGKQDDDLKVSDSR